MLKTVFIVLIIGVLMYPSIVSKCSYKEVTKLDKLGYFVYNNSSNTWEDSHFIATALITNGGPDAIDLARIAKVESDFTPHIVGDSGESIGMFQIQPKHHGFVPSNVFAQVAKARDVFVHTFNRSFVRYNGTGKQAIRYATRAKSILKGES